ncbi:hypothetical protein Mucpa_3701 [Mucilaginibacter paludis DSM 18603]|uniref:Uncharacterized protein n=1 Tax=Mucilaginibacter paludis DSM 18603 TaxID=714943 RepID=H1XZV7_9SPHI|nr:hypothetical protein Mucpa_3701 [Mucilaginibacter paludis DSM 18603]
MPVSVKSDIHFFIVTNMILIYISAVWQFPVPADPDSSQVVENYKLKIVPYRLNSLPNPLRFLFF